MTDLKRHSNMFQHGRNQSDFSWSGKERPWSTGGSEKSDQDQQDRNTAQASGTISSLNEPPRVDMFEPVSAPLADPTSDWPKWMQQFSPARPPSADPSEASTPYPDRDLRISIVAPSPISSNGTVFGQHSNHSRASSTLSGNHLHPIYAQMGFQNRPSSTRSRESLATINTSSGEPSPVLSQMTNRFPLPMTTKSGPSEGATAFTSSGWERSKPLASNNPFRNSMVVPSNSVDRSSQKSPASDDGGRNPFELELETATLNIDFTQVGVTPPRSGNSTINPTTPITPMPRRKSTSSLSLYSEEGHSMNLNPFDIGNTQPVSARAITLEDQSARNSYAEALDLASAAKQNFWPVPEAYSAQSSRRPSYTSERSGCDPAAWADELAEHNIQTPKTFSRILEMYAGRAM